MNFMNFVFFSKAELAGLRAELAGLRADLAGRVIS